MDEKLFLEWLEEAVLEGVQDEPPFNWDLSGIFDAEEQGFLGVQNSKIFKMSEGGGRFLVSVQKIN